jgi:hypothetical protein
MLFCARERAAANAAKAEHFVLRHVCDSYGGLSFSLGLLYIAFLSVKGGLWMDYSGHQGTLTQV